MPGQGVHHRHRIGFQQAFQLGAQGGKAPGLDFRHLLTVEDVGHTALQADLVMAVIGIQPVFHYSVEAAFPKGADALALPQTGQAVQPGLVERGGIEIGGGHGSGTKDRRASKQTPRSWAPVTKASPSRSAAVICRVSPSTASLTKAMEKPVRRLPFMPPGR